MTPSPRLRLSTMLALAAVTVISLIVDARLNTKLRWLIGSKIILAERWVPEPVTQPLKSFIKLSVSRAHPEVVPALVGQWREKNAEADLLALIDGGAVNPNLTIDGIPLLHRAIIEDQDKIAAVALANGADFQQPSSVGASAAVLAVEHCSAKVIRGLVDRREFRLLPSADREQLKALARRQFCTYWNAALESVDRSLVVTFPERPPATEAPRKRLVVAGEYRSTFTGANIGGDWLLVYDGHGNLLERQGVPTAIAFIAPDVDGRLVLFRARQTGDNGVGVLDSAGHVVRRQDIPVPGFAESASLNRDRSKLRVLSRSEAGAFQLFDLRYPALTTVPTQDPVIHEADVHQLVQLFELRTGTLARVAVVDAQGAVTMVAEFQPNSPGSPVRRIPAIAIAAAIDSERWLAVTPGPTGTTVTIFDGADELRTIPLGPEFPTVGHFGWVSACFGANTADVAVLVSLRGGSAIFDINVPEGKSTVSQFLPAVTLGGCAIDS